jgi:branched-chain amino acid transport system substrate-binding protein
MRKTTALALLALLLALDLWGCRRGPRVIRVGAMVPLTGYAASFGTSMGQGYALAVEEWNARGGVLGKPVALVTADDKGEPGEGLAAAGRLIQRDKVVAIMGNLTSRVCAATAVVAQASGVPMVTPGATDPRVTAVGNYVFRVCYVDTAQGTAGAIFAREHLKAGRAAVIYNCADNCAEGQARYFQERFRTLGGEVAGVEAHPPGVLDFRALLGRLLKQGPDLLYVPNYYNDVALIALQARELGYQGPILGGDGWGSTMLQHLAGPSVEGCYYTSHFSPDDPREAVQGFLLRYRRRFGVNPDAASVLAYDALNIVLEAIAKGRGTLCPRRQTTARWRGRRSGRGCASNADSCA